VIAANIIGLKDFADTFADLADPEVPAGAWD
jgi:hypothetical protein